MEQPPRGSAKQVPLAQPSTPASPEPTSRECAGNHRSKGTCRPCSPHPHLGNNASLSRDCLPENPQPTVSQVHAISAMPASMSPPPAALGSQLWLRAQGPTNDPSCSGESPGPVSYSPRQEEPSCNAPRYRAGGLLVLDRGSCGLSHPKPTWLPGRCQVNRTSLVMLL